jgi:uncharacterized protein (TIGR03435 family)
MRCMLLRDLALVSLFGSSLGVLAQTAPVFDAASVKRVRLTFAAAQMSETPVSIRYTAVTLAEVVRRAYQLEGFQLLNYSVLGSATDVYDIAAILPQGATKADIPAMLQQLLASRFNLAVHWETRRAPVYALLIDSAGLKLKPSPVAADQPELLRQRPMAVGPTGRMHLEGRMSLHDLSGILSGVTRRYLQRPVVDMTAIEGEFDIVLDARVPKLELGEGIGSESVSLPDGRQLKGDAPDLFAAVLKLGLKLEPRTAPVRYLIIDRSSKEPSEQ